MFQRSEPNRRDGIRDTNVTSSQLHRNHFGSAGGANSGANSPPKLYVPSIYNYTCRGKFTASSLSLNDRGTGGTCQGWASQLEILQAEQQVHLTRVQALERFTTLAADVDLYDYDEGGINRHEDNNELHQQTQTVLLSPALIFKPDLVQESQVATNINASTVGNNTEQLLEEELIVRQDWTCYGSTEVEYMVLQDVTTGDKHVAAVAPRNTGVSIREIETSDAVRTLTRFGLGWLDIIHDSNAVLVDDDPTATDQTVEPASMHSPDEVPPRPSLDHLAVAKQSVVRVVDFSKHVAEHVQWNAQWFISNISDDFPARTYTAGQTIVQYLPRTVELTWNAMSTIVSQWVGTEDDDDE